MNEFEPRLNALSSFTVDLSTAESYHTLRARIQSLDEPARTILITSPEAMIGKTILMVNLGITFSQVGSEILLVDADLTQPKLHKVCSIPNTKGLTDILVSGDEIKPSLQKLANGPSILTCGPPLSQALVLSSSQQIQKFIKIAVSQFDLTLIDSPPVLSGPETTLIAPFVDGVILTLQVGQTTERNAQRAKALLEAMKVRLLGVILTINVPTVLDEKRD